MNQYDALKIDDNMRGSASVTNHCCAVQVCARTRARTHTSIQSAGADEKQTM